MNRRNLIQKGLLIAAVLLILLGIGNHEFADTRNKAIRICYECIGVG